MSTRLATLASCTCSAVLTQILAVSPVQAQITFDPFTGANMDVYTGHVEGAFTVAALSGDWFEGRLFGNPTPSIFGGPHYGSPSGSIGITSGGLFTFAGSDLASNSAIGTSFTRTP